MMILIEACVDTIAAAVAAAESGANRIEINTALELDGLTPSPGLVERFGEISVPVIAMVRPRSGGFCYCDDDWKTMLADVDRFAQTDVAGLAIGMLTPEKEIDLDRCREIRQRFDRELVFHKAFDETPDWRDSLEKLIEAGFDRILTSGLAPTAKAGSSVLKQLVQEAGQQIEILPAGGIRSENAAEIVQNTGCSQIHGSFRKSEGPFGRETEDAFRVEIRTTSDNLAGLDRKE